ncbi:chloride channel protein [Niastella populi]|uniref:Chloride channel protein n=1 Tax=Niastella populi TaxID=550983 RepID=A0A1V9FCZ2_9BACT|nr:chloride channel protein [Niastella populi]OQP56248.1 chloride channel protein [Niastella populi]
MKKLIKALRLRLKWGYDQLHNERVKTNLLQAIPFWIASVITGLLAVLYTKLFSWAEMGTEWVMRHGVWWLFIITPITFVLAWWLVFRFAPGARGSGIPQVIAAVELTTPKYNHLVQKLLSVRIIFFKMVSSIIMVFGGGVVGREGPTIQIAGSVFRVINQILPSWWPKISKSNMIKAGAAAGLAAAFNTPLGGVVFAMEEVTRTHISYFKTALFTAVIIAGLTAQGLLGPYLYLGYPDVSNLSGYIFFGVIAVGVVSGLLGSGMARIILSIMKWVRSFNISKRVVYLTICALLLASMAYFISERALGSGKDIMTHALFTADKHLPWYMPLVRIVGSIISFTSGAAGGVFAPALAAGASIGAVMGEWFNVSATNVNLLILAGMVGFLTGVTRTPFTSAILVLEMTDRHNVIFHLMLAGMIATMVSYLVDRHSFYDHLKMQFIQDLHHEAIPAEGDEKQGNEELEMKDEK